jgi:hypothetical protein
MQLNTYARNLQKQFMEFKWKKKNYKTISERSPISSIKKTHKYLKTNLESRNFSTME